MFGKGGGKSEAEQTHRDASKNAGDFSGRGSAAWNGMFPTLNANATNPQGLTPTQEAQHNTATQQSIGGSNAGIVGGGALTAGRTNNPGSMLNAVGMASRGNAKNLAQDALATKEFSTNLAQQKQQAALNELGKLYGTNVSGLGDMLKNQNQADSNIVQASQNEFADTLGGIKAIGGMGMMGAGMAGMGPGGGASAMSAGSGMMG